MKLEQVLENYIPVPEAGCWLWTRGVTALGYGNFLMENKWCMAHRVFYEHFVGAIPVGMYVCHKCDTPQCVNPDHLFLGTPTQNMDDMAKKFRAGSTKLTAEAIQAIRAEYKKTPFRNNRCIELAKHFGVGRLSIYRVATSRSFRQVQP